MHQICSQGLLLLCTAAESGMCVHSQERAQQCQQSVVQHHRTKYMMLFVRIDARLFMILIRGMLIDWFYQTIAYLYAD